MTVLIPKLNYATITTSNLGGGTGNWGDAGSWGPGVPGCYDTIHIVAGDQIDILSTVDLTACPPVYLLIEGTLDFPNNGKTLKLPAGSYIEIPLGGLVSAPGNDNSNKIYIDGNVVWASNQPDIVGPSSLGVIALPIELISFEANINEGQVVLKWVTTTELNNSYFTIERSLDALTWEEVLVAPGAGNSNQLRVYEKFDYQPKKGLSYYRLKQTDFDGSFKNFNIVPVHFESINDRIKRIRLFPNPMNLGESVQLKLYNITESNLLVVVRDGRGREIYSKTVATVENGEVINLPIGLNTPKGIYLVTVFLESEIHNEKLIVR